MNFVRLVVAIGVLLLCVAGLGFIFLAMFGLLALANFGVIFFNEYSPVGLKIWAVAGIFALAVLVCVIISGIYHWLDNPESSSNQPSSGRGKGINRGKRAGSLSKKQEKKLMKELEGL